ncbi:hypothetical protein [Streptomyces sp. NPDC002537]
MNRPVDGVVGAHQHLTYTRDDTDDTDDTGSGFPASPARGTRPEPSSQ